MDGICSVHGKKRTAQNLMDDGQGGLMCAPGRECNGVGTRSQGGGKGGWAPGDWACPSCGDHQFARNTECRKCGTPNPGGGGVSYGGKMGGKGGMGGKMGGKGGGMGGMGEI